jgi:hypothetical protein
MPRHELLARLHRWLCRMSDAQLLALEADLMEGVPEVADPRYDAVVAKVRGLLGRQEDAEGLVRLLRERKCLGVFLRREGATCRRRQGTGGFI